MVPVHDVVGKAFVIVWPFDRPSGLGVPAQVFAHVPDPPLAVTAAGRAGRRTTGSRDMGGHQPAGRRGATGLRSSTADAARGTPAAADGHVLVAGMDEVGRGALAGPVTRRRGRRRPRPCRHGAARAFATPSSSRPQPARRSCPRLRRWAAAWAVGHASREEIDADGIIAALRAGGAPRARPRCPPCPTCVLLDGNHDWLTADDRAAAGRRGRALPGRAGVPSGPPRVRPALALDTAIVHTMIKADLRCAAVAAASVLAKVERDRIMVELARDYPGYGWDENKGYSAPEHGAALRRLGPARSTAAAGACRGEPAGPGWPGSTTSRAVDADELDAAELDAADRDAACPSRGHLRVDAPRAAPSGTRPATAP